MAYFFSNNPIDFNISTTADKSIRYEVYVESAFDSTVFNKIFTGEKPSDSAGDLNINIRSLLHESIEENVDDENFSFSVIAWKHTKSIGRFYYRHGVVGSDGNVAVWTTSSTHVLLYGGLSFRKYKAGDYISVDIETDNNFLTWLPDGLNVSKAQPVYLSLLNESNYGFPYVTPLVKVVAYYTDGTNQQVFRSVPISLPDSKLFTFNFGYTALTVGTINAAKTVVYYTVQLIDDGDANINTEIRRFYVDHVVPPWERYFTFINSLGGMESIRTIGKRSEGFSTDKFPIKSNTLAANTLSYRAKRQFKTEADEAYSISSGFMDAEFVKHYSKELLNSQSVFEIVNGQRLPVNILTNGADAFMDERFVHQFNFNYEYSNVFGGFEA